MSWDHGSYYLYHILLISGELLILSTLLHMLYQRRNPASMVAWLLFMVMVPYVAVFLYFIFGRRKQASRYTKSDVSLGALSNNANHQAVIQGLLTGEQQNLPQQSVTFYTDGQQAYQALTQAIVQARRQINFSTYVFKNDDVTQQLLELLTQRAKSGVKVRLLIDALGSPGVYFWQRPFKALREAGGEVVFFMPLLKIPFRNYINLRNHRKIYLIDEHKVFSGGMNLSSEYLGPTADNNRWHDTLFEIDGLAALGFSKIFASDWLYAAKETLTVSDESAIECVGDTRVQVVPSGPDLKGDVLYEALLNAIFDAKKRLWIVTPYFIPDESLSRALVIAQNRGVDVRIITPRTSNHLVADLARASFMSELYEHKVGLYLVEGVMVHAKAVLFDDHAALLGSVNLDNRSLFLNYEVATFVASPRLVAEVDEWMAGLMAESAEKIPSRSHLRRVLENLMRIFAPAL
ncbi:cardiolipin synthase [Halioxenophilus aromaticivorans]|uniref:Cardiolipin synthase n=1 Tax=Halioxenophilus aromaticivorans TaxID=1306992 RepID=A0AAV3U0X1_9ALTE